jgi:hypothetical protein
MFRFFNRQHVVTDHAAGRAGTDSQRTFRAADTLSRR